MVALGLLATTRYPAMQTTRHHPALWQALCAMHAALQQPPCTYTPTAAYRALVRGGTPARTLRWCQAFAARHGTQALVHALWQGCYGGRKLPGAVWRLGVAANDALGAWG